MTIAACHVDNIQTKTNLIPIEWRIESNSHHDSMGAKFSYYPITDTTSQNNLTLVGLSYGSTSLEDFNKSVEFATKNLHSILNHLINHNNDFSQARLNEIIAWYRAHHNVAQQAISSYVLNTGDSYNASLAIGKLASIKNDATLGERKDLLYKFMDSKYFRLRYASISGLFYLGDVNDVTKIDEYKQQEKNLSLKPLYERLIIFLNG